MSGKHIKWLQHEIESWTRTGLVPGDVAERLQSHYAARAEDSHTNRFLLFFGALGATLVGLGVILLIAYNWDALPRSGRTLVSLLPLLLGQALVLYGLLQNAGRAWRESSAFFLVLSVGAAIAMISQTYNIPGDIGRFMLSWTLLSIPLVYLCRVHLTAVACMVGIVSWAGYVSVDSMHNAWLFSAWALLGLLLPHIWKSVRAHATGEGAAFLLWALVIAASVLLGLSQNFALKGFGWILYLIWFSLIYMAGAWISPASASAWRKPLQTIGALGALVVAYSCSWAAWWRYVVREGYDYRSSLQSDLWVVDLAIAGILMVGLIILMVLHWRRSDKEVFLLGSLPLVLAPLYFIVLSTRTALPAVVIINLHLFVIGVFLTIRGIRQARLGQTNAGMFLVALLILFRFLDADISILMRAVVFIVAGMGMIAINMRLLRASERKRT